MAIFSFTPPPPPQKKYIDILLVEPMQKHEWLSLTIRNQNNVNAIKWLIVYDSANNLEFAS